MHTIVLSENHCGKDINTIKNQSYNFKISWRTKTSFDWFYVLDVWTFNRHMIQIYLSAKFVKWIEYRRLWSLLVKYLILISFSSTICFAFLPRRTIRFNVFYWESTLTQLQQCFHLSNSREMKPKLFRKYSPCGSARAYFYYYARSNNVCATAPWRGSCSNLRRGECCSRGLPISFIRK